MREAGVDSPEDSEIPSMKCDELTGSDGEATANLSKCNDAPKTFTNAKNFEVNEGVNLEKVQVVEEQQQTDFVENVEICKLSPISASSSRPKRKILSGESQDVNGSVALDASSGEDEPKLKPRRKSKLSLNWDVRNKSKYKDTNQASITSFFQKMSPSEQKHGESGTQEQVQSSMQKEKPLEEKENLTSNGIVSVNCAELQLTKGRNQSNTEDDEVPVMKRKKKKFRSTKEESKRAKHKKKRVGLTNAPEEERTSSKSENKQNVKEDCSKSSKSKTKIEKDDESSTSTDAEKNVITINDVKQSKPAEKDKLQKLSLRRKSDKEPAVDEELTEQDEATKPDWKTGEKALNKSKEEKSLKAVKINEVQEESNDNKKECEENDLHERKVEPIKLSKKSLKENKTSEETTRSKSKEKKDEPAKLKRRTQREGVKNNEKKKLEPTKPAKAKNKLTGKSESSDEKTKNKANHKLQEPESSNKDLRENSEAKEKKVRFSEDLQEFSPEPIRKKTTKIENKEENADTIIEENPKCEATEMDTNIEETYKNKIKNAFTFMMDNRHKSIGQNSPGKEAENLEECPEVRKEGKRKLLARKAIFQDWADTKGAKKRKVEDEEKGIVIGKKLKRRAKRLKKMLTQEQSMDDSQDKSEIAVKKRKVTCIIESDSDDSKECKIEVTVNNCPAETRKRKRKSETNEVMEIDDVSDGEGFVTHKRPKLLLLDSSNTECLVIEDEPSLDSHFNGKLDDHLATADKHNADSNLNDKKSKNSPTTPLQQTELSSFFGIVTNTKKSHTIPESRSKLQLKSSDTENSKAPKDKKKKNMQKSKLTLKKNRDGGGTSTSDDISNSPIETTNDHTLSECKSVETEFLCEKSNGEVQYRNGHVEMVLTPRTAQKWKMRVRINLTEDEKLADIKTLTDDEEIQPKTKKTPQVLASSDSDSDEPLVSKQDRKERSEQDEKPLKPVKLAPLFIRAKPKPKLDKATIEARRKFLHSDLPESLRKVIEKQQRVEDVEYQVFPTVSHVTVKPTNEQLTNGAINFWDLPPVDLNLTNFESYPPNIGSINLGTITNAKVEIDTNMQFQEPPKVTKFRNILKTIKMENPDYPVYKAFRFLHQRHLNHGKRPETQAKPDTKLKKSKRGRPKKKSKAPADNIEIVEPSDTSGGHKLNKREIWTDLYKPCASGEIFGNHASICQLKTWLTTWLEFSEEINMQRSKRKRRSSDSSSDFESTDAESRDSSKLPGNTIILRGPHGSGKTTAVYALCSELGVSVLELNASSKRTGKRLLLELQEATQSHQVRKKDSNSLTMFLKKDESRPAGQSSSSQSSDSQSSPSETKMCLLLIEDVDIVFEQDESFINALCQLLATSKRPVVLTTTDANCLHLKKFFVQYPIITFVPLSAKILATWLQVLCLVEGLHVDRRTIVELLERSRGDVRSTLLQLQFWVQSGGQSKMYDKITVRASTNLEKFGPEENLYKDESSNISWLNEENTAEQEGAINIIHGNCLDSFGCGRNCSTLHTTLPLDLGNVWWNLANILSMPLPLTHINKICKITKSEALEEAKPQSSVQCKPLDNKTESQNLKNVLNILETLAMTDTMYEKLYVDCDLEPVHRNTDSRVKNGLELSESMENHCASRDLSYEWSHTLFDGYVNLYKNEEMASSSISYSSVTEKQWRAKQNKCQETLLEAVPVLCHLDHSSVNMDYSSTLRTMARSEMVRANSNNKRGNRFYNYLRGLGISCSDSFFQTADNVFKCEP